jgi:hypothetical protein
MKNRRTKDVEPTPIPPSKPSSVRLSGRKYPYAPWDGRKLAGRVLAIGVGTTPIFGLKVPRLVLISASTGTVNVVISPDQLGRFLRLHRGRHYVCHDVRLFFWVINRHLSRAGEERARGIWWKLADGGRLHDTMLLDQLIRLAETDAPPQDRSLAVVARDYAGIGASELDERCIDFGPTPGEDLRRVDRVYLDHAIRDTIATHAAYLEMSEIAERLMEENGLDVEELAHRFGLLSESIQVRAAIALAVPTRLGLGVDSARVRAAYRVHRRRLDELVGKLVAMPESDGLFRYDRQGRLEWTPKGGRPSMSIERLREILAEIAAELGDDAFFQIPETRTGLISTSPKVWEEIGGESPFVRSWIDMERAAKILEFLANLDACRVHPEYVTLVRSGRTSCTSPNIQQTPREGGLRELFVPRPGFVFLIIDYSCLELRTLAWVLEVSYGESRLARVIRQGIDPHAYTAAMFAGLNMSSFMRLKRSNDPRKRKKFETLRQKAKAINFGIPGGLGPAALVDYARTAYGVEMTLEEAREFRERLVTVVYPELELFLADDAMGVLARNLGATEQDCWDRLDMRGDRSGAVVGGVRRVVAGERANAAGRPYDSAYVAGVWDALNILNQDEELGPLLASRQGSESLADRLFRSSVEVLSGRLRGGVGYAQERNTRFQGLAADGAKGALWALIKGGYRVAAFVHDEFVIELPEGADHAAEARSIEKILVREMEKLTGDVPISCEYSLARRWSKQARSIFDNRGRLIVWELGD